MTKMNWIYSGTRDERPSERELLHGRLARNMATEGIVLLKNENILPLDESVSIALFGSGAAETVKGGIGSGDVNSRVNVSIYQGLKDAGVSITSEEWITDFIIRYESARNAWKQKILEDAKKVENPFDAYSANPFSFPEGRRIKATDIKGAFAAVYVLSRISGEGKDRRKEEGDYYLSKQEREDILYLDRENIPVILVLNAGGPVELTDILEKTTNVKAILNISQPGQEGGHAVADILLGKAVPSGKLTTTWARHYEDYPTSGEFSYLNGNLKREEYKEGIYVGYRYFDSFGIQPLFPFGYGLSYTDFSIKYEELHVAEEELEISVLVTNTGKKYSGKEVVQVYVTLPQTGLNKEYKRLVGFVKTDDIKPGETQKLTVVVAQKQLASFSEQTHAWVIEAGNYGVWIGKHSEELCLEAVVEIAETVVLEKTEKICPKTATFEDIKAPASLEKKASEWISEAKKQKVPVFHFVPQREMKQETKKVFFKTLASELPVEELISLLYGNITDGASTLGSAGIHVPGSAGETTGRLEEKYGKRSLIMADGPAGLRLSQSYEVDRETDTIYGMGVLGSLENGFLEPMVHHDGADTYYQYCTAFPVETALAQTWNLELMYQFGRTIATEMKEFHVDLWLAPGLNIHRNPLCGRNFEYYSEDPFLSGMMAAAVTCGVQSRKGCGVTIKHFACNNQEDNRMGVDACVSERTLREIYLRGFEIAVKQSAPVAIMTSYNLINGVHAANSYDLCTTVARKEWGFEGVIMSDWSTTAPQDGSIPWKCVAAGNDIIMPGNPNDDKDIRCAYSTGELSEEAIRDCAERTLTLIDKLDI